MIKKNAKLWLLNNIELFDELNPDQKIVLQNSTNEHKYAKKEFVFKTGDKMSHVYFVMQGRIKITKASDTEKEIIKRVLRSGDYFGELAAIDADNNTIFNDSAVVLAKDTVVLSIPTEVFKEVIETNSSLYQEVIKNVLSNHRRLNNRLDSVMLKNSRMRIVDFIKEMAEDIGKPVGYEMLVKHNLTHQQIANITGISRQKVTTILNEFKQEGLIHLERNSILVHDKKLLE
ncbi:MAG TPA: Crp/Fnr family transcriptional regulator [Brumimicrobium sp.]|nr:Crp/Fnr family transcriptional regulator [Brumimicrobium sp.]